MGLIIDEWPPRQEARRRNVLERVFLGAFAMGLAAGAFAASVIWLVVR